MKKIFAVILALLTVITISLAITGCGETAEPHAEAFILGNHMNFPKVNLLTELTRNKIQECTSTFGDCFIIVSDGDPYVAASYSISKPDKMLDSTKLKHIAKANTDKIISDATSAYAKTPEIDLLNAFDTACGLLKGSTAVTKGISVCDSGMSTTGLLDFTASNLIDSDPENIVSELKRLYSLPDFNGIKVTWTGIGEAVGNQPRPTAEFKHKLKEIWRAIIVAGGGSVDFYDISLSQEVIEGLPHCSTVAIIQNGLQLSENTVTPITEKDVAFEKDSSVFKDRSKALEVLTPFAEILTADRSRVILIAGSTASVGDDAGCEILSLQRAEACKQLLCELGVSGNQIKTTGLGRAVCPLRVDDLDENGSLIPEMAEKNRAVFIMDISSDTAKTLLNY